MNKQQEEILLAIAAHLGENLETDGSALLKSANTLIVYFNESTHCKIKLQPANYNTFEVSVQVQSVFHTTSTVSFKPTTTTTRTNTLDSLSFLYNKDESDSLDTVMSDIETFAELFV